MKFTVAVVVAAASSLVAAEGAHRHAHRHHHKRDAVVTTTVAAPPVIVYQLDGTDVPAADVCNGIKEGKYKWADGAAPAGACAPTPTSSVLPVTAAEFFQKTSTTTSSSTSTPPPPPPTTTSTSIASSSSTTSVVAPSPSPQSSQSSQSSAKGLTAPFPDGVLSCDTFPSDYGAVAIEYLNLGGWIGVQQLTLNSLLTEVTNIVTVIGGSGASGSCQDGATCSFACPPGWMKAQWPPYQGSTGQSVGGLLCKNGFLHKTNQDHDTLCIQGVDAVSAQNTLGEVVSVCQTDYPGTESETVPTEVQPGQTIQLTNPDGSSYYQWQNKSTSAQFYINPKGVPASTACQWGTPGNPWGNYAPINLGVGFSNGITYASIFPNSPTTDAKLDFNVKFTGDITTECKYENGAFSSGPSGCTVSIPEGKSANVVFY